MRYTALPPALKPAIIPSALKQDERIVCTNATVIMDGKGNISYFNNETAICVIGEDEK